MNHSSSGNDFKLLFHVLTLNPFSVKEWAAGATTWTGRTSVGVFLFFYTVCFFDSVKAFFTERFVSCEIVENESTTGSLNLVVSAREFRKQQALVYH